MFLGLGLLEMIPLLVVAGSWGAFAAWSWTHLRSRTLWLGDEIRWRRGVIGGGLGLTAGLPALLWALVSGLNPAVMLEAPALMLLGTMMFVTLPVGLWSGYLVGRMALPQGAPALPGGAGDPALPGGERPAR